MAKCKIKDDATELLNDFESKRSNSSPILLFTSDDWDPFELGTPECLREFGAATLLWYWKKTTSYFGADSGGCINTSYIERINLTIRNSLARFIHK